MAGLGRRLDALEQLAADLHRREVRALLASLPEAHGLTAAELDEATDDAIRSLERAEDLRRRGMTERQILRHEAERIAAELGCTAEEIIADAEQFAAGITTEEDPRWREGRGSGDPASRRVAAAQS